jgi:uncharacterized repeat protein (TIGR04138 family)
LALRDGRYSPDALAFLFESLETAVRLAGKAEAQGTARHVTGGELLSGLTTHARETFGPLAPHVWRSWGVREALDWGRIVFLLVDAGLLKRQEEDRIEDFGSEIDFEREFVDSYRMPLPKTLDPRGGPAREV